MMMIMNTGRKQKMIGNSILTVSLAAFSSVRWVRLSRIWTDWMRSVSAIGTPCFCAWRSAVTSWRISADLGAVGQRPKRLGARYAGADVVHGPSEFVGQRTLRRRRDPGDRRVEPEAGFDADRHLVDHVGCVGLDPVLTVVAHAEYPVVGQEEQRRSGDDRQQHLAVDEQRQRRHGCERDLDAEHARQVEPVGMAGLDEVHLEAVDHRVGQHPSSGLTELAHDRGQRQRARAPAPGARRRGFRVRPKAAP